MSQKPIRVLVADDSALMRDMISGMLSSDPEIEVVGAVPDPIIAREKIKQLNPDVLTLDIEMPRMDGITFLEKLMALRPMPVVMISSLTQEGADATLRALEIGAVDFVAKPAINLQSGLLAKQTEIVAKVKAAARAHVRTWAPHAAEIAVLKRPPGYSSTEKVILIGASTGGVEALNHLILQMPPDSPAILITQHMPEQFTASFARRLDTRRRSASPKPATGSAHCRAMPISRQGTGISGSAAPVQTTPAASKERIASAATVLRSMCCFIRRRNWPEKTPLASSSPAWARTAPMACSPCAGAVPARWARTSAVAWSTACPRWRTRSAPPRLNCLSPG